MGNANIHSNTNAPSDLEKKAAQVANQCKTFIAKVIKPQKIDIESSTDFYILQAEVRSTLDKIHQEAIDQGLEEISNYYYLYLLQQVSRLNMYF